MFIDSKFERVTQIHCHSASLELQNKEEQSLVIFLYPDKITGEKFLIINVDKFAFNFGPSLDGAKSALSNLILKLC